MTLFPTKTFWPNETSLPIWSFANMNPVPDAAAFANLRAFVDDGGGVDSDGGHFSSMNGVCYFVGQRHRGGPFTAQNSYKISCTVNGVFPGCSAGV